MLTIYLKKAKNRIKKYWTFIWKSIYFGICFKRIKVKHGIPEIYTDMTKEERISLLNISKNLSKNNVIVEIGSYLGASSVILAIGAKQTNGHLYCVDTWQNDAMSEGKRDTYGQFQTNTNNLTKWITPKKGYSEDIAREFLDKIDLLFIDGDHSYDSVKNDLDIWLPKLNENAWVIMHDSGWADGVKRVINEVILPIQTEKPKVWPNMYAARINYTKP
jgi:predicted O-methyltransferase YrrM